MTPARRRELTALRRARDLMDRRFAEPLVVADVAAAAFMSPAHFGRRFRAVYGETPHAYLMTRRVERAGVLLRAGATVTEACVQVGASSLGSFSSSFTRLTGVPPSAYRRVADAPLGRLPDCAVRLLGRRPKPGRNGEAARGPALLSSAP